jgi:hypothetical protein
VYSQHGDAGTINENALYYVRCVRAGPHWSFDPLDHLVIESEGTVSDTKTGLQWQRSDDGVQRAWDGAQSYCEELSLDGYDDWRLPTREELETIIDHTADSPAISTEVFECRSSLYWSGTSYAYDPGDAWAVGFNYGGLTTRPKGNYDPFVRCVRAGPRRSFDPLNPLVVSLAASETSG